MTEPDVTLTDYAIALECAIFAALLVRQRVADVVTRRWWVVFFAAIGAGALAGGTVHGFFLAPSPTKTVLWRGTLLTLGVASAAMWMIGARLAVPPPYATWVRRAAVAQLAVYAAIVLLADDRFVVAIATYVPATIFLMIVIIVLHRRTPDGALAAAIAGFVLTFVAAAVQVLQIGIHPRYFNHNAVYHVIQAIALWLILLGARRTVAPAMASGEAIA